MAQFKTGARPTPRHKLCGATPHKISDGTPSQVIVVPPFLEPWLNDTYGICVTAEECFAKAAYAVMNGLPETKISDRTELAFADKYGWRDGADLTEVMDKMISDGFHQDGVAYQDGPYSSVDYSNEPLLQNALSKGPVKIGIDAGALPGGAGNKNGWYASGGQPGQFRNEDHCVALCSFGPAPALFQALGVPTPNGFPANGYHLYTWGTIGVVDHAWIMSTCGEAWLRNPTTTGVVPIPPTPPPPNSPDTITVTVTLAPGSYALTDLAGVFYGTLDVTGTVHPGVYPIITTGPIPPASFGSASITTAVSPGQYPVPGAGTLSVKTLLLPGLSYNLGPFAQAHQTVAFTIPPFLLVILSMLCSGALPIPLPAPWGALLPLLCGLLPHKHRQLASAGAGYSILLTPEQHYRVSEAVRTTFGCGCK